MDDAILKEKLRWRQLFLVHSDLERARLEVFNYATENLNATKLDKNLDQFCHLKCATKVNLAFGCILKIKTKRDSGIFTHTKNDNMLDRLEFVCTKVKLTKLRDFFNETDVSKLCCSEGMNTKFYKLTNLTVFAASLKDVLVGCHDAVLHKSLIQTAPSTVLRQKIPQDN